MNREPRTMQVADAATASREPENTPAMVKKIGKTTYKVHVHFSNTSTETMSDKIKRMLKNEIQQMKECRMTVGMVFITWVIKLQKCDIISIE